jgi:ribosomal protein S18 acetylase RimI-like enzyme
MDQPVKFMSCDHFRPSDRPDVRMGDVAFMTRRAEPSDWETYRAIRLRSLQEEPTAYASQYEIERHYTADLWKQWMGNGGTFLAFDDDQILVGTATALRTADGDTLVVGMYVAPEARGQGCAQRLLDAIADLASQRQDRRLVLEVSESNLRAASCYRSYGFVETGRRRAMERDPTIIEIELGYLLGD